MEKNGQLLKWGDRVSLVYLAVAVWNLTVFALYALDKYRAKTGGWRVPEKTLLLSALLLGGVGGLCGMGLLRHKTRHWYFRLLLPLAAFLTVAAVLWLNQKGFPV